MQKQKHKTMKKKEKLQKLKEMIKSIKNHEFAGLCHAHLLSNNYTGNELTEDFPEFERFNKGIGMFWFKNNTHRLIACYWVYLLIYFKKERE